MYGDALAATLLEILCREWIAPACSNPFARRILESLRYVDDLLASSDKPDALWTAMTDLGQALNSFNFKWKKIFSSKLWHLGYDKTASLNDYPDAIETVFHHQWNFQNDSIIIIPNFNTSKKVRGSYSGPPLQETDLSSLQVTRRVASRLLGQCYDPTGAFLSPLQSAFKCFFSLICSCTSGWDDKPESEKIVSDYLDFLSNIKASISLLKSWPRCFRYKDATGCW